MRFISEDANLTAGERARTVTALFQGHAEQSDGYLLAGGKQNIHFSWRRLLHHFQGHGSQAIRFSTHGGYHNHHVVAAVTKFGNLLCDRFNSLD